jgi:hypothetical protein
MWFVIFFLLGDSLAYEFYVPMFWNTVSSFIGHVNRKNNWDKPSSLVPVFLLVHATCEDRADLVFRNIGTQDSDAGESPKKKEYNIHNKAKV